MVRVTRELDCFNAHIRLKEPSKSKDKVECKATDSKAMSLATLCYCRGRTSMESSIPCSHGGRALVVKGAEEVENAEAKKLHKTDIDELLIKIAENDGLWVDVGVLDQGTK
ncbi:hypothetical protein BHE74_00057209 [Ensete ventricosum]|nr:hypothetical protein BHE74_00057209 [Ensete ventricosum]